SLPHPFPRRLVEFPYLGIGVGEDDPAAVRRCLPVAVPALDQIVAGLLARLRLMHHVMAVIGMDGVSRSAGRQVARAVALPVLTLAADGLDLDAAMALMDRAERRARLYCLQLLSRMVSMTWA